MGISLGFLDQFSSLWAKWCYS